MWIYIFHHFPDFWIFPELTVARAGIEDLTLIILNVLLRLDRPKTELPFPPGRFPLTP